MLLVLVAFAGLATLTLLSTLVPRPRLIDKLAIAALLAVCAVMNPGKTSHVEALRRTAIRHAHLDAMVIHDDYFFASTTTTHRSLTFGVLGRVFVVDLRRGRPEERRR